MCQILVINGQARHAPRFLFDRLNRRLAESYTREAALIATGCLLGEIIGHLPGYEAHWVTAPEFGAVGAGLYVIDLENQTAVTCNPIGRVFQLYQTGEEMNLASFVETVKEALKQTPEDEETSFDSEPFSQDDEPQD